MNLVLPAGLVGTPVNNATQVTFPLASPISIPSLNFNGSQSTLSGLTGTAIWSMPLQGADWKKFIANLSGFTSAGSSIIFPTAFSNTPFLTGASGAVAIATVNTGTLTLTAVGATNGVLVVEGF